jgi:hypothetical protein
MRAKLLALPLTAVLAIAGATPALAVPTDPDTDRSHITSGHGYVRPAPKRPKVPRVLRLIRGCESGSGPHSPGNYAAANPASTASGAYQFLDSTWRGRFGVRRAKYAKKWQQDKAAIDEHRRNGTSPWAASRHCWARAL